VPQGATKTIQHLEGGIVQELSVREGDKVETGTPLLRLQLGTGGVNRAELAVRRDGLSLRRARLAAEAAGADVSFSEELEKRRPELAASERAAQQTRRRELETALSVLVQQGSQRESELKEYQESLAALRKDLGISREKLQISTNLLMDGLTSRLEHLDAQRDVNRLDGELKGMTAKISKARSALAEAKARQTELRERYAGTVREELGTVEIDLRRAEELLAEATAQSRRTLIRSPIDGTVKKLRHNTIGGVVRPGEPIMEIVPERDRLVIEARLDPTDRGYVRPGQPALVKLTTYDFIRYGGLDGTVVRISPDSETSSTGRPYFTVVVETDKTWLGDEKGALPISPGMEAVVDIKTGERSVIDYLLRPVLKLRSEAFRER
jgi:adhesin transport system membrane fusion protein